MFKSKNSITWVTALFTIESDFVHKLGESTALKKIVWRSRRLKIELMGNGWRIFDIASVKRGLVPWIYGSKFSDMCRKVCAHKNVVDKDGWFFDSTWESKFPLRFYSGLKKAEIAQIFKGFNNPKIFTRLLHKTLEFVSQELNFYGWRVHITII